MRRELATRLNAATDQGSTLLLITHDPLLLTDVADRCMVVDEQVRFLSPNEAAAVISA
ncbi:hypothetical protein ACT3TS_03680 [Specibacter sp. AOP5-B1-6]|uniref:hypothetical protein n=1 Tax=Specibacter sp. AOP5-B1-6 TaxID=3457653 RepID=UPI00402B277A